MTEPTLLPPPLASDERFSMLAKLAAQISAIDLSPLLVYLVDTVSASALPSLAQQFSLVGDGWELAESDDARRALIRRAIELHRYKGTPWSIREVIRRLGLGEVTLIEGLNANDRDGAIQRDGLYVHGDPTQWAVYRVILSAPVTNDQAEQLRQLLAAYAPARCHLASLEYQAVANRHNGAIQRNKQYNRGSA
ncbi:phage tail protein I [Neisseriaceae bacterium TC5R-5]|nr:phage tail protein I [Neisseriaceae bacterium TC5R-5]